MFLSKQLTRQALNKTKSGLAQNALKTRALTSVQAMNFGHGPYNPLNFKKMLVPDEMPTTEDIYANVKTFHSEPPPPVYNMRHIHPVRQSGPIPSYDGTWTMEDIKKLYGNMRAPWDATMQSTHIDELMRRVPGLTRREGLRI